MDPAGLTLGCHSILDYTDVFQSILEAAQSYNPIIREINGTICFCDEDSCNNCTGDIDMGDCDGGRKSTRLMIVLM